MEERCKVLDTKTPPWIDGAVDGTVDGEFYLALMLAIMLRGLILFMPACWR